MLCDLELSDRHALGILLSLLVVCLFLTVIQIMYNLFCCVPLPLFFHFKSFLGKVRNKEPQAVFFRKMKI